MESCQNVDGLTMSNIHNGSHTYVMAKMVNRTFVIC